MVFHIDISNWQVIALVPCFGVLYCGGLALYRLTIHPLARFPGPKLAAITRYYEAYWDVVQNGQYTFQIERLHKKYGPIIRISPHELHVIDPAFFDEIYSREGRWDKYGWAMDAWGAPGATVFTTEHFVHKGRRASLNPYFAKNKITANQFQAKEYIAKLCDRIRSFAASGEVFNLGAASTAVSRDITYKYVIGKNYDDLGQDDFNLPILASGRGSGSSWRVGKHVRWLIPLMTSLPISLVMKIADKNMQVFLLHIQVSCSMNASKHVEI